ncbi:MAG: GNAT family N-acetyltransferase [Nocardioidaceae bacterium]
MPELRVASFGELDPRVAYEMWALRVAVFVVEQRCAYLELDGRDLEPCTRHVWVAEGALLLGCLRVLREPSGEARIGRVCVRQDARGTGLAAGLVGKALVEVDSPAGTRPCVLDAQSHVARWYERFGFAVSGPEFVEDGIPHLPMRRPPF